MINQTIDLANFISGVQGFVVQGVGGSYSGYSVSGAGDVNGDGYADIIVGAPFASPNGRAQAGVSYIIFGKDSGFSTIDLAAFTSGANGFIIQGGTASNYFGQSVSEAGDVNGDGCADVIVGAPFASPNGRAQAGVSYIIFGKDSGFSTIDLAAFVSGANGFIIQGGAAYDWLGYSVSGAGDVNGDGYADVIIGSALSNPKARAVAGYVIFGKDSGFSTIDLASFTSGSQGFIVKGSLGGYQVSVSGAGDINGDGYADVIIGIPSALSNGVGYIGASYIIFGKASGFSTIDLASFTSDSQGFIVKGSMGCPISVSGAGDVNGDGYADVIIGHPCVLSNGAGNGAYVIFGKANGFSTIDLASFTSGFQGFVVQGAMANYTSSAPISVSGAGDVNRDGYADIIITDGAPGVRTSYVIFSKASGFNTIDLAAFTSGANGFIIQRVVNSQGPTVSDAGDINGDGYADVIVGVPYASPNSRSYAGASYIIFGGSTQNTLSSATLSPYTSLLASSLVYDDLPNSYSMPSGWLALVSSTDSGVPETAKQSGYFGRAYINSQTKTVLIAHRGTDPVWSADLYSDLQLLNDAVPNQFAAAKAFIDYVLQLITSGKYPNVQYIGFTGHSLGGALAELSSAKYHYAAVTFDSPGVLEVMQANKIAFTSEDISYANANIITYNAAPNLINTMADHVGQVYRIYADISNLYTQSNQPSISVYGNLLNSNSYTNNQHSRINIIPQFNSQTGIPYVCGVQLPWPSGTIIGYNGYDHYAAYDLNTFYWDSYVNDRIGSIANYLGGTREFLYTIAKTALLPIALKTAYTSQGVSVLGDNNNNIIWGTTNFADNVQTGTGNDIIYLHNGNDVVVDKGGYDTYILPIDYQGNKVISDGEGLGVLKIINIALAGSALPVFQSNCPSVSAGSYFLNINKIGGYYLSLQGNNLVITKECFASSQVITNSITISNFNWGNLGINKYTANDTVVLVGSNDNDALYCSLYNKIFGTCIASALAGNDILVAYIGQNAILTGGNVGQKTFKILHSNSFGTNSFDTLASDNTNSISINGIKGGDVIDLTSLPDISSAQISHNGTDAYISLNGINILHMQVNYGDSYVGVNLINGNASVTSLDMAVVINQTLANNAVSTASSHANTFLKIGLPIIASLLVAGTGIYVAYKCYKEGGAYCLGFNTKALVATTVAVEVASAPKAHAFIEVYFSDDHDFGNAFRLNGLEVEDNVTDCNITNPCFAVLEI